MNRTDNPFDPNLPVHVYWNLHAKRWSVRQRGLVVGHAEFLVLDDVEWRVQPKGRERVLRQKKKNVHAYACGMLTDGWLAGLGWERAHYNPYKAATFMAGDPGTPLYRSKVATFSWRTNEEGGKSPTCFVRDY